jgi:hypothetical protein
MTTLQIAARCYLVTRTHLLREFSHLPMLPEYVIARTRLRLSYWDKTTCSYHHKHDRAFTLLLGSHIFPGTVMRLELLTLMATAVSLLPSSSCFSRSSTLVTSSPSPVTPRQSLASSRADIGCSDTIAGAKRTNSGFITSRDAQMIDTLSSIVDHVNAKVPDAVLRD